MKRRSLLSLLASSVVLLVVESGCASTSGVAASSATAPVSSISTDLASYYDQTIEWGACDTSGYECGTVSVPLDYSNPDDGGVIDIAVDVHRASSGSAKGYLLFNPGGPGGSGYDYLQDSLDYLFSDELIADYDIVGFDPRGVNHSSGVKCFDSDAEKDDFLYGVLTGDPGSDEYVRQATERLENFAQGCERLSGDILPYLDTVSAAKDMDIIRAALGEDSLDYLGFSYGTLLGTEYASLFPGRVGRFVLDGAEDPSLSVTDVSYGQMTGFDGAIRAYLANCVSSSSCPFSGSTEDAVSQLSDLLDSLQASPLENSDGRQLGSLNMLQAIVDGMYSQSYWATLSGVIADVQEGDATSTFALLDAFNSRSSSGSYADNSTEAFYAIMCLDYPRRTDSAQIAEDAERYLQGSELLGEYYADGTAMCEGWPVEPVREPATVSAEGSGPILVVGTTGDPATPYAWAQSLAEQLQNSELLTVKGYHHTAYSSQASTCVRNAVDSLFTKGVLPASGTTCSS